jgi:ankyrin repeat protein
MAMNETPEERRCYRLHTHLWSAAVFGDVNVARYWLARNAEVNNPRNPNWQSPLLIAASRGDMEMAALFREAGATVGPPEAAFLGETDVLRQYLDAGVSVEYAVHGYGSLLGIAASGGNLKTVQMLVERAANVRPVGGTGRRTPLAMAARKGHREVASYLAQMTPPVGLLEAIMLGDMNKVTMFLAAGADPNMPIDNLLPLSAAAMTGQAVVARLLLDRGANVFGSIQKKVDDIPPMRVSAAEREATRVGWTEIVLLLQEYGLPANKPDLDGLFAADADIDKQDSKGRSALMRAIWGGRMDKVQHLLERGANPRLVDDQGMTGLNLIHGWTWRYGFEIQSLLLSLDLDVNTQDNEGVTPLMRAAGGDYGELVQLYLDHGATRTLRDAKGQSALDYAHNKPDIVTMLSA